MALLAEGSEIVAGTACGVFHCAPPLHIATPEPMSPELVADLSLTRVELEVIDAWLADLRQQVMPAGRFAHYILIPPAERVFDRESGRPVHWRFSCAGFVCKTYEHAGLTLVALDSLRVDRATLEETWGASMVRFAEARTGPRGFGLEGPPPWPVLLPSHLFHAVEAGRDKLPLRPSAEQNRF